MTDTTQTEPSPAHDDPVATSILDALANGKALRFKDVAITIAEARRRPKDRPDLWKRYMNAVKQQAIHLARQGRIEIVRKGTVADPNDFKGLVRIRLPKKDT